MQEFDEEKPYIFVSYSHKDQEAVVPIINRIKNEKYNVWYDDGIDPGTEFDEYIASHLDKCTVLIAMISQNFIGSDYCKSEVRVAKNKKKKILCIYLSEINLTGGIELTIGGYQAICKYKYTSEDDFYQRMFECTLFKHVLQGDKADQKYEDNDASLDQGDELVTEDRCLSVKYRMKKRVIILIGILSVLIMSGIVIAILCLSGPKSIISIVPYAEPKTMYHCQDKIYFTITSTTYDIVEIISRQEYMATGISVDEDLVEAHSKEVKIGVTAPVANGAYIFTLTVKNSNGEIHSDEFEYLIVDGDYEISITADIESGSTISNADRVVITASTNNEFSRLYSVSYQITSSVLLDPVTETHIYNQSYCVDFKMPQLSKPGEYSIEIIAVDGNGCSKSKTFTYTVSDVSDKKH